MEIGKTPFGDHGLVELFCDGSASNQALEVIGLAVSLAFPGIAAAGLYHLAEERARRPELKSRSHVRDEIRHAPAESDLTPSVTARPDKYYTGRRDHGAGVGRNASGPRAASDHSAPFCTSFCVFRLRDIDSKDFAIRGLPTDSQD
jgi:hypothetical protein